MEFHELMMAQEFISTGGIDYARELLEKSLGTQKAVDIINRLTSSLQVRPFDFIRRTDPAHLLNFIQQEHPQTIALILAYLEPQKASVILGSLPARDPVRRRQAHCHHGPHLPRGPPRGGAGAGEEAFHPVLGGLHRGRRRGEHRGDPQHGGPLHGEDHRGVPGRGRPELAEEIKKRMFVFEDIVLLDDRAIQKVLREVDTAELAKALKSVDSEVQDKIYRNMSKRASTLLKEDMDYMGPIRLKDVEEAQQRIVAIIRKLEEQGEIVVARAGEEELVV